MAWFYLLLILVIFYAPVIGVGPWLLGMDFEIPALGISVPFSGSLWLVGISMGIWLILWRATIWLEERAGLDIILWLDKRSGLNLQQRWLYTTRPLISQRLVGRLANLALGVSLYKALVPIILGAVVTFVVPWLAERAIGWLTGLLAGADHLGFLIEWLSGPVVEWLEGSLVAMLRDLVADLLGWDIYAALLPLAVVVVSACEAMEWERRWRLRRSMERLQSGRRKHPQG